MIRKFFRIIVVPVLVAAAFGCAKSNPDAPAFDGGHPAGWVRQHGLAFISNSDQCRACHGDDLRGGIAGSALAGVSAGPGLAGGCFAENFNGTSCHGGTGPLAHPETVQVERPEGTIQQLNWVVPGTPDPDIQAHAKYAMDKPTGFVAPGVPSGFTTCQPCHGERFAGRTLPGLDSGTTVQASSCVGCHGNGAAHGSVEWDTRHTGTNPDNAPACGVCHFHDPNLNVISGAFAPAGTPVGCFTGTLCHFVPGSGHPTGDLWVPPSIHGAHAKTFPNPPTDGFVNCRLCHEATFTTNCAGVCHGPPHPEDWKGTGTFTHQNADQANAPACEPCHSRGQNSPITLTNPAPAGTSPGCFNSTLCHGDISAPHTFPFSGALHKDASTSGCFTCHIAGSAGAAYPAAPETPPNCRGCHLNAVPTDDPHCSDCHGSATTGRPNGSTFPNRAGRHGMGEHGVACSTCHSGGGTGASTHGNSNRVVKTARDVKVTFSGDAAGMSFTRTGTSGTCTGTCHGETHRGFTW